MIQIQIQICLFDFAPASAALASYIRYIQWYTLLQMIRKEKRKDNNNEKLNDPVGD